MISAWAIGTYTSEADFISKIVKAANAVLSILKVMIFDEAESVSTSQ